MGCDIHMYVEKFHEGKWRAVKGPNPFRREGIGVEKSMLSHWLYHGRNYHLFSLLADVRNGGDIVPIDYPRGLPDEPSELVQKAADAWDFDGHSHSYYYYSELLDIGEEPFREIERRFSDRVFPILHTLSDGDSDSVRIVFWFDN
jgi:hypothetical protein